MLEREAEEAKQNMRSVQLAPRAKTRDGVSLETGGRSEGFAGGGVGWGRPKRVCFRLLAALIGLELGSTPFLWVPGRWMGFWGVGWGPGCMGHQGLVVGEAWGEDPKGFLMEADECNIQVEGEN